MRHVYVFRQGAKGFFVIIAGFENQATEGWETTCVCPDYSWCATAVSAVRERGQPGHSGTADTAWPSPRRAGDTGAAPHRSAFIFLGRIGRLQLPMGADHPHVGDTRRVRPRMSAHGVCRLLWLEGDRDHAQVGNLVSGDCVDRCLFWIRRGGIAISWEGAKILFIIFLVLAVLSFLGHGFRGRWLRGLAGPRPGTVRERSCREPFALGDCPGIMVSGSFVG